MSAASERRAAVWETLRPGAEVYAVLDGAADPSLRDRVRDSLLPGACLHKGSLPEPMARAAPYLVQLAPGHALTEWLFGERWGRSLGIFCTATATLGELTLHFRRLLKVRTEAGRELFFRFYDPRVLAAYLPTCRRDELEYVFGPVDQYCTEQRGGGALLHAFDGRVHTARALGARAGGGARSDRALAPAAADPLEEVERLRAALLGRPRAPELLARLGALSAAAWPELRAAGAGWLEALAARGPAFEPDALRGAIGAWSVPAPAPPPAAVFACLASEAAARDLGAAGPRLARGLAVVALEEVARVELRACLAALEHELPIEAAVERVEAGRRAILDRIAASPARADPAIVALAGHVERCAARLRGRRNLRLAGIRAALLSLKVSLGFSGDEPVPVSPSLAEAAESAVRATTSR